MTDIKLPAGYEDWVEVSLPEVRYTCLAPLAQKYLRVSHGLFELHMDGAYREVQGGARYFVPPKPKPVLPDVKPGAVIQFISRAGSVRRAIRGRTGWRVFEDGTPIVYCGMDWAQPIAGTQDLLEDVNADGFTVELA